MPKFAVGHADLYNNELKVEIIEAENWYSALMRHSMLDQAHLPEDERFELPQSSLEDAKREAFNCDQLIDVVELLSP